MLKTYNWPDAEYIICFIFVIFQIRRKKKKTALKCREVKLPEVLLTESNTDGIWTQISWTVNVRIFYFHSVYLPIYLFLQCCVLIETFEQWLPGSSDGKACAWNVGDLGSLSGSGRSPGEGNGDTLQYSSLENPMDGRAWWAMMHGVSKSWTQLSDFIEYCHIKLKIFFLHPLQLYFYIRPAIFLTDFFCWSSICSFHLNLWNLVKHPHQKHTQTIHTVLSFFFFFFFFFTLLLFLWYL